MTLYRKKPVVIEAKKHSNVSTAKEIAEWIRSYEGECSVITENGRLVSFKIKTLEGDMKVITGDYVIRGVAGEFYPCKPGIFRQTYERIS